MKYRKQILLIVLSLLIMALLWDSAAGYSDAIVGQNDFECKVTSGTHISSCLIYNFSFDQGDQSTKAITIEGSADFRCEIIVEKNGSMVPVHCLFTNFEY